MKQASNREPSRNAAAVAVYPDVELKAGGYPGEWTGRFIWDNAEPLPVNRYMMFRKTFDLDTAPASALLLVAAADKYQVWVNGEYAGRGPVRTVGPQWTAYDPYRVERLLRPGTNSIAVLVFFHGRMNGFSQDQRAGLFAQMEMTFGSASAPVIWGTDGTWKLRPAAGWRRDTREVNACYAAFTEVCDLGADPADWREPGFGDDAWEAATVLSDRFQSAADERDPRYVPGTPPDCWSYLEPRPIPPLREDKLAPVRVARVAEAGLADGLVGIAFPAERMLIETVRDLKQASVDGAAHLVDGGGVCVVRSRVPASGPRPENLIRNHPCRVYGPFGEYAPAPDAAAWTEPPQQIELGGVIRDGETARLADGCLDPGDICGKDFCGPRPGGTAMVVVPFHLDRAMELTLGAGADYWLQLSLDGRTMIDTVGDQAGGCVPAGQGNRRWPPSSLDHQATARIEAGDHLLAVRLMRGQASSMLALSILPTGLPDAAADPVLILDFGRPVFAAPSVTFDAPAGVVVDAGYGFNLTGGRVATLDHQVRHADRCISRAGRQTWQPFRPLTVFRYLQLVFRTGGAPVKVETVRAATLEYPVQERGSFSCSDPVLDRVWKAGVATVYLHMEDMLVCDAIRERAFYCLMGELEQHYLAAVSAWGKVAMAEAHFRLMARGQNRDGTFPQMLIGCSNLPQHGFPALKLPVVRANTQTVPNYTPMYVQGVLRWHRMFPSKAFLEEQFPVLCRLAVWCGQHSHRETGLLYHLPKWRWFDWTANDLKGAHLGTNALYYKALVDMAEIARILELPRYEKKWTAAAQRVGESLRASHWNEERGLFADSVFEGRQSTVFTELSNALTLLYGIADAEQSRRVSGHLLTPPPDLARVTPLYFHYVIETLLALGEDAYAWQYLSQRWAPAMTEMESPMLTEEWDWRRASPCHGGGAGVVWSLSTHALGVYPLEEGHRRVRIDPRTGGLSWAKGVVPADCGDIRVEWRKEPAGLTIDVEIPAGVTGEIALPVPAGAKAYITLDGRPQDAASVRRAATPAGERWLLPIGPGRHRATISTAGKHD